MKKSFTILLSFLLLLSTTGITVSKHYCGDFLKNSALFIQAEGCGDMEMPSDCCHDEIDHFEIQDDFQTTQLAFDLSQQYTIASFLPISFIDNVSDSEDTKFSFVEPPSPPIIKRHIYIEVQSFLI